MKIQLTHYNQVVAEGYEGETLRYGDLWVSPAVIGPLPMGYAIRAHPEQPPAPEVPLRPLTPAEFRLMLLGLGHTMQEVTDKIALIPDPLVRERTSIYWEYATEFVIDDALLLSFADFAFGYSPTQVRTFWEDFVQ